MSSHRLLLFSLISAVVGTVLKMLALLFLRKVSHLTHTKIRVALDGTCPSLGWQSYAQALIQAEDHRFLFHCGVDCIALSRAFYQTLVCRCRQGGSTIEQQLVRTLTGDYRRCYSRKLRELLIASTIASAFGKRDVLKAYLSVAHFGTGIVGLNQAIKEIVISDRVADYRAAYLIAHLRYPFPKYTRDHLYTRRFKRMLVIAYYCEAPPTKPFELTRYNNHKSLVLRRLLSPFTNGSSCSITDYKY